MNQTTPHMTTKTTSTRRARTPNTMEVNKSTPHTPTHDDTTTTKSAKTNKTHPTHPHTRRKHENHDNERKSKNATRTRRKRENDQRRTKNATRRRRERETSERANEDERTRTKGGGGGGLSLPPHPPVLLTRRSAPAGLGHQSWFPRRGVLGDIPPPSPQDQGELSPSHPPSSLPLLSPFVGPLLTTCSLGTLTRFASFISFITCRSVPSLPRSRGTSFALLPDGGTGFSGTQPHQLPITALDELAEQK